MLLDGGGLGGGELGPGMGFEGGFGQVGVRRGAGQAGQQGVKGAIGAVV